MAPGEGVKLHKHPYKEIFVIQEGEVTFTVGTATLQGCAGQIIIMPEETPHKFVNRGQGQLRQVDIHTSHTFITDWLEG
jgi:mannose-6-phosphate isomerase-like protein (cupin superfamily)